MLAPDLRTASLFSSRYESISVLRTALIILPESFLPVFSFVVIILGCMPSALGFSLRNLASVRMVSFSRTTSSSRKSTASPSAALMPRFLPVVSPMPPSSMYFSLLFAFSNFWTYASYTGFAVFRGEPSTIITSWGRYSWFSIDDSVSASSLGLSRVGMITEIFGKLFSRVTTFNK